MEVTMRRARMDDYQRLCELFAEVDALHVERFPELFRMAQPARDREYIRQILEDELSAIFVAEAAGELAGFVQVMVRDAPPVEVMVPRRFAVVDTLGVSEKHRRLGIGKALMEKAEQFAAERGAGDVELNVYLFNQGAVRFYEELGYTPERQRMRKKIE